MLANRLSGNPTVNVLLIERGTVNDTLLSTNILLTIPPYGLIPAKGIKTVPQKELESNSDVVWESSMLGGRTRINGSLYLPGCRAEYDTWGKGWQWDDISGFFLRSEGRVELESGKRDSSREGNEWKTRVIQPQFESSRQ